jgi:hypothetical protein
MPVINTRVNRGSKGFVALCDILGAKGVLWAGRKPQKESTRQSVSRGDVMCFMLTYLNSVCKKAALAAVALGGLLSFGGVASAQAHEVVVVRRPIVVVRPGFDGPRPFYYYGYGRPVIIEHGWRDRFGCWHRY